MSQEKVRIRNNEMGYWLSGIVSSPDEPGNYPAVVYVHGFKSSKESRKAQVFLEQMPGKGMVFLAVDLSGCGESNGDFADSTVTKYAEDVRSAINFAATIPNVDTKRIALAGSSLGGMVSIVAAAEDPRIKAMVLFSPVSDFKQLADFSDRDEMDTWRIEGLKEAFDQKGEKFAIKYGFYTDGIKHNVYAEAEKISCPVLIIHGDKDEDVGISQSYELIHHLGKQKMEVIAGADHHYSSIPHFTKAINLAMDFLEDNLR